MLQDHQFMDWQNGHFSVITLFITTEGLQNKMDID